MKNNKGNKTVSVLNFLASFCFYICAIINFINDKETLCLGLLMRSRNGLIANTSKIPICETIIQWHRKNVKLILRLAI